MKSAQATANTLSDDGFALSFNYVGEYSKTLDEAIAARNEYSELLNDYQDE